MELFSRLSKNKLTKVIGGLIFFVILMYIVIFAYNTFYQPSLNIPDQKTWTDNQIVVEAKTLLAKRWNTDFSQISVLSVWETGNGTFINLLQKESMSGARLFLPVGNSMNPIPQHPYYREIAENSVGFLSASFGTLYITEEYITQTSKERIIIRNYYAGKYPWFKSPSYKVIVRVNPKHGWFNIGSKYYSLFMGIPLDPFPLQT